MLFYDWSNLTKFFRLAFLNIIAIELNCALASHSWIGDVCFLLLEFRTHQCECLTLGLGSDQLRGIVFIMIAWFYGFCRSLYVRLPAAGYPR